jgi:hypothetical protein
MLYENISLPPIEELERARTLLKNQINGACALFGDAARELQTSHSGLRIVEDLIDSYYSDPQKEIGF